MGVLGAAGKTSMVKDDKGGVIAGDRGKVGAKSGRLNFVCALAGDVTRPKGRDCPACGTKVKRGQTACGSCGHDFASAAAAQGAAQATQFGPGWYPYSAEPGTERYWTGSAWSEQQRPIAVR